MPGVVRVYRLQDAVVTWQYKDNLTGAFLRFYYGGLQSEHLVLWTQDSNVFHINDSYKDRLTHSVSDSTISYTLQEIEDKDATGGVYTVDITIDMENSQNSDACIFIYCEYYITAELGFTITNHPHDHV